MHLFSNLANNLTEKKNGTLLAFLYGGQTRSQVLVARDGKQLGTEGGCNKADDMALRDIVQECNNKLPRAFKKRQYNC